MTNTLLLRSPGLITDTTGLTVFPDITSDLFVDLDPALVTGLASGARVTSVIAGGDGPTRERTFDQTGSSPWVKPQWIADAGGGKPALRFDGSSQLRNSTINDDPPPRAQPMTVCWVGALASAPGVAHNGRLFARSYSVAGRGFVSQSVDADGSVAMMTEPQGGGSWVYNDGVAPSPITRRRCILHVFNGPASYIYEAGSGRAVAAANGMMEGIRLGVSSAAAGSGLLGDTQRHMFFARAFTPAECAELYATMVEEYAL